MQDTFSAGGRSVWVASVCVLRMYKYCICIGRTFTMSVYGSILWKSMERLRMSTLCLYQYMVDKARLVASRANWNSAIHSV